MSKKIHENTSRKRSMRLRRISFYFLVILLISLSIFIIKSINKNKNIDEFEQVDEIYEEDNTLSSEEISNLVYLLEHEVKYENLGDIKSIIEYETNRLIGAHYPLFDKTNIDGITEKLVMGYIKEFKNGLAKNSYDKEDYKYELAIDYEVYLAPMDIISIGFNIMENASSLAHPIEEIETKVYDLSKDKEVELLDIMHGEYLEFISETIKNYFTTNEEYKNSVDSDQFREGIYPSKENFSNFILKEEEIQFIFPKYKLFSGNFGMPSVDIAYIDLKEYIKPDFFQAFTKEEYSREKDIVDNDKVDIDIEIPERKIDPEKPMVALTFDDGPNKDVTIPILDVLKEYEAVATFFILGNRVPSNVDVLERVLEEGSEIGNHSYSHKELTKLSHEGVVEQISRTQDIINQSIGIEPKLMRPTYGSYNDSLKSQIDMPFILWSIDTLDWKSRNSKMVTDHVLENVKDGDVILMHDIYESTAEAVKLIVPELVKRGYQLVTVSELFESRGEEFKEGQIYYKKTK